MPIRKMFQLIYSVTILLLLGLGAVSTLMIKNYTELNENQKIRYQSYLIANELRQSSDDLTRMARTYIITGDSRYEKMYWDILAIRNGEKPRPKNYERIYWDLVLNYGDKPRPDGQAMPLVERMKTLGFTGEELGKLKEAQDNSDGLVTTEKIAMNAIKGLFDDGAGNFTKKDRPDFELARRIMFDETYHGDKASIMNPIDDFFIMFDKRTKTGVDILERKGNVCLSLIFAVIVILIITSVSSYLIIQNRILKQLGADPSVLSDIAQKIASGALDYHLQNEEKEHTGIYAAMRKMLDSLKQKTDMASMIASGNLSADVQLLSEGDALGKALKLMSEKLREIIGKVDNASMQVVSGSRHISDSSHSLSRKAAEQASSLEQISSSMIEIGSQIAANAANASRANQLAAQAREGADQGAEEMTNMISAMEDINGASQAIAKIIKVIDDIAFQTNLLALNAAVEAARAGRHGKGFAVVAGEVRNLASRSAKAAKETAELIEEAVNKAEKGNTIANRTARALNDIMESVNKVAELMGEIAASSREQAQAVGQVNQGVGQIDQVTQQNAANVQESASAAETLFGQASQLRQILAQFKLSDDVRSQQVPAQRYEDHFPHETLPVTQYTKRTDPAKSEDFRGITQNDILSDDEELGKY